MLSVMENVVLKVYIYAHTYTNKHIYAAERGLWGNLKDHQKWGKGT